MARFHYQALDRGGQRLSGEIEAATDRAAIADLQAKGLWPIGVKPASAGMWRQRLRKILGRRRTNLPPKTLAQVIERLGMLTTAGISIERALEIEANAGEGSAALCLRLRERVRNGQALSIALAAEGAGIPPIVTGMIHAGEAGGFLPLALTRLAAMLLRQVETSDKIDAALAYPRLLLIAAGLFLLLILGLVLPQFRPLFEETRIEPPLVAAILFALSRVVEEYFVLIAVAVPVGVLALRRWLSTPAGRLMIARARLRLPQLRPLTEAEEAGRFCRSLATLTGARLALPEAVRLAGETLRNPVIVGSLRSLPARISEGRGLSAQLRQAAVLPGVVADLVQVGEETGRLPEMLERAATLFERDAETRSARLMAMLVPGVTIALGLVVAVMIGAVVNLLIGLNELAG